MNLYKNYCYQDLQSVADSLQSEAVLAGFGLVRSVLVFPPSQLSVVYTIANGSSRTVLLTFPSCSQLGFNNSYSGMTLADSIEISGLILLVLASAYSIKLLRRGL